MEPQVIHAVFNTLEVSIHYWAWGMYYSFCVLLMHGNVFGE